MKRSIAVLLLVLAFVAGPARGQGTNGMLPDPISSRDLSRYADRLGLSDDQRLAIEAFHDDYRDGFRRLRENEIEAFLTEASNLDFGFRMLQQPDVIKDALDEVQKLTGRIRRLDEQLLARVETVLTEDQLLNMIRVRQARERARYRSGLARFARFVNPSTRVDVVELLDRIEIDPAALETVDPIVRQYETSLTAASRKVYDTTANLAEEMFERLAEMGLTEEVMADPRQRGRMWQSMMVVWTELTGKLAEKTWRITELNRRVVQELKTALPEAPARRLYDAFYSDAYAESGAGDNPARPQLATALSFDDLTDGQRQDISDLRVGFDATADRLTEEAADLLDDFRKKRRSFFGPDGGARNDLETSLGDLRTRREQANGTAMESLAALLGPDLATRIESRIAAAENGGSNVYDAPPAAGPARGGAPVAETDADAAGEAAEDPFLPRPISTREVRGYCGKLGVGEDAYPIASSMHDDYLASFRRIESAEIRAVRDAQERLWTLDEQTGQMAPPKPEQIEHVYELRRKAVAAASDADDQFVSNLATLSDAHDAHAIAARMKLSRQRLVYRQAIRAGAAMPTYMGRGGRESSRDGTTEATVDLSLIVDEVDEGLARSETVAATLGVYERKATGVFRQAWDATLALREAIDKMSGNRGSWRGGYRRLMENEGKGLTDARNEMLALNRATLETLETAVSPSLRADLRHAYYRQSFPDVYDDPHAPQAVLSAAIGLDDLSPHQRSALTDMSAGHRAAYDDLSVKMVEVRLAESTQAAPEDRGNWQARAERQRTLERLRADRDDLNHKTLLRLRALLDDGQAGRLGIDGELERAIK